MRPTLRALATLSTALVLAACSGGGAPTAAPTTAAATTGAVATSGPVATSAPVVTTPPTCEEPEAGTATTVEASVGGFAWGAVTANVGDVVTWTNGDGVPHRVALDDGSCEMSGNIPGGGSKSLRFNVAGTFPFHCAVHSTMKGTIVIT